MKKEDNNGPLKAMAKLLSFLPTSLSALGMITILVSVAVILDDPVFASYKVYTDKALTILSYGVFAAMCYYLLVSSCKRLFPAHYDGNIAYGAARMACNTEPKSLPKERHHRYAIHEAGHILSFALYKDKPDVIEAWVKPYINNLNGNVYHEFTDIRPFNVSHIKEVMKTQIAGGCAEEIVLGSMELGSESDFTGWEAAARQYLGSVYNSGFTWFVVPSNDAEARVNASSLEKLKQGQWEELRAFFLANKDLLIEIAESLKGVDKLETEVTYSLLEKAILAQ